MPLIVIEGLDGSGKDTQSALLEKGLEKLFVSAVRVNFPNYRSPSSSLVKMYLDGEFGRDPMKVNAFAVASFYAADRFASYETSWKRDFEKGKLIVANRYTTSNIVFQMTKLPRSRWEEFINWTEDLEYNKMRLPKPDFVFYLDLPVDVSQKLMSSRYEGDESKKDIHEKDVEFLKLCRETASYAAKKCGWHIFNCAANGNIRPAQDIAKDILKFVVENIK